MKQTFSKKWKASKQPRKQRKYRANAPKHIKRKFLSATLSKPLRKKYNKRSIRLRKGDQIKVLRGQFRKKEGKIVNILLEKCRVHIDSVQHLKKDGSKTFYPIHASNLMVLELDTSDKFRKLSLEGKNDTSKKTKSA